MCIPLTFCRLQLAVKDKIIKRQKLVLSENGLARIVGYEQLAAMERALMDADTPATPPSPPRNLRRKNNSQFANSGPQEEVDQISSAYSNPPSARDPEPHSTSDPYSEKVKIPPISQVKSSSDPSRIITGSKSVLGKKVPSPIKQADLHSEYDESQGHGDFDIEESEDFHRKPRQQILKKKHLQDINNDGPGSPCSDDAEESSDHIGMGRQMHKKPKAPALIFPSDSEPKIPSKAVRQAGINQIAPAVGQKVARVPPSKGGRGVIQNEERWMEGGAAVAVPMMGAPYNHNPSNDLDSKYQPTTPRGQKSHQRGSYESKFDRERLHNPPPQRPPQQQIHPSNSSQSDDGLEVLDDISESYDNQSNHNLGGYGDDDQSIASDISVEKGNGYSSPGQENHPRDNQNGPKTRLRKQKNSVLGKLNKQKPKIDPIEESYGNGGGLSAAPSIQDLQVGPSHVPPGMMIPSSGQGSQISSQQPRSTKQTKSGSSNSR